MNYNESPQLFSLGRLPQFDDKLLRLHRKSDGLYPGYFELLANLLDLRLPELNNDKPVPLPKVKEEKPKVVYPPLPKGFKNLNPVVLRENDYIQYTSDFFTNEYYKSKIDELKKYENNIKEAEEKIEKIKGQRGEEISEERDALHNVIKVAKHKISAIKRIPGKSLQEQHDDTKQQILNLIIARFKKDKGILEGDVKDFVLGRLTNKAINEDKVWEFYPTPYEVVDIMIERADIQPGMKILEPSGGKGNILDKIYEKFGDTVELETVEFDETNRQILKFKGYNIVGGDFLETNPEPIYDRILMNPPFKDTVDIDHVMHALKFLKPTGKLVAITSMRSVASKKMPKTIAFRNLIEETGNFVVLPPDIMLKAERAATVQIIMSIIDNKKVLAKEQFLTSEDIKISEITTDTILINKTNDRFYNVLSVNPFIIEDRVTKKKKDFGYIDKVIGIFKIYDKEDLYERELFSQYAVGRQSGSRTIIRGNSKDAEWRKSGLVDARPGLTRTAIVGRVSERVSKALMPHQLDGANLAIESLEKHGSFILADGTGAGKTFQQLAVAHYYLEKYPNKPVLIFSQSDDILQQAFKGDANKLFAKTGVDISKVMVHEQSLLKDIHKMPSKLKPGHIYLFKYKDFSLFDIKTDPLYKKYIVLLDEKAKLNSKIKIAKEKVEYLRRSNPQQYEKEIKDINKEFKPELDTINSKVLEAEEAFIEAEKKYFANVGRQVSCAILDECHNVKNYIWYAADKNIQARRAVNMISECPARMFCSATPADRADAIFYMKYAGLFIDNKQMHELLLRIGFDYIDAKYNDKDELIARGKYNLPGNYDKSIASKTIENMFDDLTEEGKMLKREIEMNNITLEVINIDSGKTAKIINEKIAEAAAENKKDKTNLYMEQMRAIEPFKIKKAIEIADKELAKGRSVVIFAGLVAEDGTTKDYGGYKSGTIQDIYDIMSKKYGADQVGVIIGEGNKFDFQGTSNRQKNIDDFQKNKKRLLIATSASGGVGISLDDSDQYDENGKLISEGGFVPRSMIVLTAPLNAEGNVQMIGRINRANTRSRSNVYYLFDMNIVIEQWLASIVERKMMFLNAVVSGQTNKMNIKSLEHRKKVHDNEEELDAMVMINQYKDDDEEQKKERIRRHKFFDLNLLNKETTGINTNIIATKKYDEWRKTYTITVNTPARLSTKSLYDDNDFFARFGFELVVGGQQARYSGSVITASFHKDSDNLVLAWNYICNLILPEESKYISSEKQLYHINDKVIANEILQDRISNIQIQKGEKGIITNVRSIEVAGGVYKFTYDIKFGNDIVKRIEQASLKPENFVIDLNYKEVFETINNNRSIDIDEVISKLDLGKLLDPMFSEYEIFPSLIKNGIIHFIIKRKSNYGNIGWLIKAVPEGDSYKLERINKDEFSYNYDYRYFAEIFEPENFDKIELAVRDEIDSAIGIFNDRMKSENMLDGLRGLTDVEETPPLPNSNAIYDYKDVAKSKDLTEIWAKHKQELIDKYTVTADYRRVQYTAYPKSVNSRLIAVPLNHLQKGYYNSSIINAGHINLRSGEFTVNAAVPEEIKAEAAETLNNFLKDLKACQNAYAENLSGLNDLMTMDQFMQNAEFDEEDIVAARRVVDNYNGSPIFTDEEKNLPTIESVGNPRRIGYNQEFTGDDFSKAKSDMPDDELPRLVTANDIVKRDFPQKPLKLNRTKALFGTLLDDAHVFIFGSEGSGKSTFALQFGEDLNVNGKVLYVYGEEKIGERLKRLILRNKINAPNMSFLPTKEFSEIKEYLDTGKFRFVIIDSHNIINAKQSELMNLINEYKNISFTFISRMDKEQKTYKGDGDWGYELDTTILVMKGEAQTQKHRDGEVGHKLSVFKKRSYNF